MLVGGLGIFVIFPYIGNNHLNWLVFFGVETTNQHRNWMNDRIFEIQMINDRNWITKTTGIRPIITYKWEPLEGDFWEMYVIEYLPINGKTYFA